MKEIYQFMDEYCIELGWTSKKTYGIIIPSVEKVIINIRVMMAETLLHEFYHYKFPELGEPEVEKLAKGKLLSLTKEQIFQLTDRILLLSDWKI